MGSKQDLRFAIAALIAGVAWGYLRHRHDGRAPVFALLQGIEWFVAYGGAAALIEGGRRLLEEMPEEDSGGHAHQSLSPGSDGADGHRGVTG